MNPDASTIAAGAPIEVDLTPIATGQDIKVFWRGKPIYIMNRTKKQIEEARAAEDSGDVRGCEAAAAEAEKSLAP